MKIDGIPVVDAKKDLVITINEEDIRRSNKKNPHSCAAAKACLRQVKCKMARVHIAQTYLLVGKKWVRYSTPASLRTEIISFDRGSTFEPGEHTLKKPAPTREIGARRGQASGPKPNKKKRAAPHFVGGVRPRGPQHEGKRAARKKA